MCAFDVDWLGYFFGHFELIFQDIANLLFGLFLRFPLTFRKAIEAQDITSLLAFLYSYSIYQQFYFSFTLVLGDSC